MRKVYLFIILGVCFFSCTNKNKTANQNDVSKDLYSEVQTGGVKMIPIETSVGKFNVWTKKFGNNPRIKILLLHGGPAFTHEYLESFESFFPNEGFEMYEYDQLGSYYSDQPKDSSLWVTERFVEEVEQVRKALGLNKDNFYLYGNSWGGILAMEYALKYQDNLKGLIISNMMASIPDYEKYNNILRSQMRKGLLDTLDSYEKKGDFKNPVYQDLVMKEYYSQHICRLPEWPDPVNRAFKHYNEEIYVMMQGPSEFKTGGRLYTWNRKADLPKIKVPTLTVGAHYDTMDPEHMKWMSTQVQQGRYLYCPEGSHLSMWDDQKHFFPGVIEFIKDVDAGKFTAEK
ncbi:MAG TPA: proline iminopeptidase-family hydrolase [Chitinophagaceae bacterium]|nr:proline iminopeptidase-family hydrolase [Chitinophagaceae bacterium]